MIQRSRDRRLLAARLQWLASQGRLPSGQFLLRDDFSSDDPAPLESPRTCEPGPGTATVSGDASLFSISGGILSTSGVSTSDELLTDIFTRAAGLAFYSHSTGRAGRGMRWGVKFNNLNPNRFEYVSGLFRAGTRSNRVFELPVPAETDDLHMLLVARTNGTLHIYRVGSSGAWLLAKTERGLDISTTSNLRGTLSGPSGGSDDYQAMRIFQLGAPFNSDFGLAVLHQASYPAGTQLSIPADALVELTWTAVASAVLEVSLRRTDDDNRWILRGDQAGGTVKLIERNAGVETERTSVAQTWTPGTDYHVQVRAYGQRIQPAVDSQGKGVYNSASFNQTANGLVVNANLANLAVYPVELAWNARRELARFVE